MDIQPFDFHRIFLGDVPLWFAAEIVFRVTFLYAFSLVMIRFIARRAVSQLSLIEFLLVIALGSSVGDPMFYPDVPLLHGMIVVATVVFLNRLVVHLINRVETFETFLEGRPKQVVKSGKIDLKELKNAQLDREKLFELLRYREIEHLGQVHAAFLEQGGELTIFRGLPEEQVPGLRVSPPWDIAPPTIYRADSVLVEDDIFACTFCGELRRSRPRVPLGRCSNDHAQWTRASSPNPLSAKRE